MSQLNIDDRIIVKGIVSGLQRGAEYTVDFTYDGLYKLRRVRTKGRICLKCVRFDTNEIDGLIGHKIIKK